MKMSLHLPEHLSTGSVKPSETQQIEPAPPQLPLTQHDFPLLKNLFYSIFKDTWGKSNLQGEQYHYIEIL